MREHVLNLVRLLDRRQYQVFVACPAEQKLNAVFWEIGAEVFPVEIGDGVKPRHDLTAVHDLRKIITRQQIQVVHAHGAKAGILGRLAARGSGALLVVTDHNFLSGSARPLWQRNFYFLVNRLLDSHTSAHIAVSRAMAMDLQNSFRIPPHKVATIPNGIDLSRFNVINELKRARQQLGLPPDGPVVGTVSRLVYEKGIDLFLRAAREIQQVMPQVSYLIIGDGPQLRELKELAQALELKKVVFAGARQDVPKLLPLLSVYVAPSRQEGLSVAVLEALASRRAVAAFEVGGLPELVRTGATGILVHPGDYRQLAMAVVRLLNNPSYARRLGENGRLLVEREYRIEDMVARTSALYQSLLR